LVNNRTQAVVCDDLAMSSYAVYHNPKPEPKTKDKADLLEAFLGALYIDKVHFNLFRLYIYNSLKSLKFLEH
jgi:dsRNA-specific ribonuclease